MDFFAKASAWLAGGMGVGGIDWAALAAQGEPGVHSNEYIKQYMSPAFARASVTMASLDLHPGTTTEVLLDYYKLRDKLSGVADKALQVVGTTIQVVNPVLAPTVAWSALNNLLYYAWSVSFVGFQSHLTGRVLRSGVADADVAFHAQLITMMFNLLSKLDSMGMLKPFKKDGTSGLGIAPALLGALIVLGIVLIIAAAWMVIAIYESARINERIDAACKRAIETGSPQDQAMCQQMQASNNPLANTVPEAVSGVIEKISLVAMVGAGLWLAVQFGPGIATKLKQSVASWKAA